VKSFNLCLNFTVVAEVHKKVDKIKVSVKENYRNKSKNELATHHSLFTLMATGPIGMFSLS